MEDLGTHKLRRAFFSGYRVADVEILVAQISLRLAHLTSELQSTRTRLDGSETDRRELARRLDEAHGRELELVTRVAAAEAERDRAQQDAVLRSSRAVDSAELDAARIRADAALEAERVRGQVEELLRLREELAQAIRHVGSELERVLRGDDAPAVTAAPAEPRPRPARPPEPPAPVPAPAPAPQIFDELVEIDAGPFPDLASLSDFETSLGRLPKVANVYIRRFHGHQATLELQLDEPTTLIDDLARLVPSAVNVDRADERRIEVTIGAPERAQ
ncbi:MAG TPA: hypothetical protein VI408_12615 [Gaiellaceae bacterium]